MASNFKSKKTSNVKPRVDKSVFSSTANKTKAINVGVKIMRGGIRL